MSNNQYDPKASNPKDAIGATKLPLDLVPDTGIAYAALAFLEGALKYGKYNWRIAGVRWSVYEAALKRHLQKVKEGEWADPVTKVPHLGSALACILIAIDAYENGKLIDDRPPSFQGASKFIDSFPETVEHLKKVFEKHNPHQYTIKDTQNVDWTGEQTHQGGVLPTPDIYGPVYGEDAQSLPGRDSGHVVFRGCFGPVGGVEVAGKESESKIEESEGRTYMLDPSGRLVEWPVRGGKKG